MQSGRHHTGVRVSTAEEAATVAALRERVARVRGFFAAVCHPSVSADPDRSLLRIMTDALTCQHSDGSWGSDDTPRQKPCFTAQTITMLYRLGIRYDKSAHGGREAIGTGWVVQRATEWLETVQHADGGWGEDSWDTCQVLLALHLCGYRTGERCVSRALDRLRCDVAGDWPDRESYWFGAGFMGAAMQVFNQFEDPEFASRACNQIWEFWDDESACFRSPGESDGRHAPASWQTACALSGFQSFGPVPLVHERIDRAYAWLVKSQSPEGSWGTGPWHIASYCTLQAINALCNNGNSGDREIAERGTAWFIRAYSIDRPLVIRLMTAAAVARTTSERLVTPMPFYWIEEIIDLLDQYRLLWEQQPDKPQVVEGELVGGLGHWIDLDRQLSGTRAQLDGAMRRTAELAEELRRARESEAGVRAMLDRYALKMTARQLTVLVVVIALLVLLTGVLAR